LGNSAFSAFGSTSPVHDPGGDRIRWFCPRLISGPKVLAQALEPLLELERQQRVSRLTVRLVSEGNLSPGCMELLQGMGFQVEARIPLGGPRCLVMTYTGKCSEERRSNPDDVRREQLMLDAIAAQERKGPARILAEFRRQVDFSVEVLGPTSLDQPDVDRLIRMHGETFPTFPYDFSKKLEIMRSQPDDYVMACVRSRSDGQIHAFSNLEFNNLELDDGSRLYLAEFDNSMRADSPAKQPAIKRLGNVLRLKLALVAARRDVDLCHSESRAGQRAINTISHHLGMVFGGVLEKHLLISGPNDIEYTSPSRFENMNVWYLNREGLRGIARACEGQPEDRLTTG